MSRSEPPTPFDAERARQIIDAELAAARAFYGADGEGATALLPILHALQEAFGWVPDEVAPTLALALHISIADVLGVVSFYDDFRDAAPGRRVLKVCAAEACQARGSDALLAHLKVEHGLLPGSTADDGSVTIETVFCLGNCALGPAALLDDRPIGRLDDTRVDALLVAARR